MSTHTVTLGLPGSDVLEMLRGYLVDFHGDYVACVVSNQAGTDTQYILVMGGEIAETSSGFSFDSSRIVLLNPITGNAPGNHFYGSLKESTYTDSGVIDNPEHYVCFSSVGVHPRLQSEQLLREGVPVYAFATLLLLCVGAVCCGVSGVFRHLH